MTSDNAGKFCLGNEWRGPYAKMELLVAYKLMVGHCSHGLGNWLDGHTHSCSLVETTQCAKPWPSSVLCLSAHGLDHLSAHRLNLLS